MTPKQTGEASLTQRAVSAMRAAVDAVVEDHRRRGKPIVVWREGKVVREMPPKTRVVGETAVSYGTDTVQKVDNEN